MRPGDQLASTACSTRVLVIRANVDSQVVVACGGKPMVPAVGAASGPDGALPGTLVGKRYVDGTGSLELLCTASGGGSLTCDGVPMAVKAPKPLPASD